MIIKYNLTLILLIFFYRFSFADTYIWEDYDDFSGSTLDTSKWGTMYFYGGVTPTIENGKMSLSSGGLNLTVQNQFKDGWEQIIATWDEQDPEVYAYLTDESVVGVSAEVSLPYDSSVGAAVHLNFNNLNSENGASIEIMYDGGSTNIYLEIEGQDDAFPSISAELGRIYKFSIYYQNDSLSLLIDDQQVGSITIPNLSPNMIGIGAFNDEGQSFDIPVDNVRVLRRSQEISEPDPETIVSDPNGQAVVVQVGDEYKWNNSLDGITLWMVHEDAEDGWFGATVQYEGGIQKGSIGLTDQVGPNLVVNHPYIIDENGMIKVTEDTAFQYYQVTDVENGVIVTADDSTFPLSDTSRFFITREAAEQYYYSKVGYPNPNGWLWFDHYPWVYSHKEQGWLYFKPSGGKLMYYSHKNKIWREFSQ